MNLPIRTLVLLWILFASVATPAADIVVNEIMFHPRQPLDGPEPVGEEYIELFNRGTNAVSLNGWRLGRGVDYVFGNVTMPAGGYLVVAADANQFGIRYPGVAPVVGNWVGRLGNRWQGLDLIDVAGHVEDSVTYATQGDWAVRVKGPVLAGTRGWEWYSAGDGDGASLELINPRFPNVHGQSWAASRIEGGTPGAPNSVFQEELPPLILDVAHSPAIPRSTDSVLIQAKLLAVDTTPVDARVHYRDASTTTPPDFIAVTLADDGQNGDQAAGDGVFAARLPAQAAGTVIEFYIEASTPAGGQRTWPAPAFNEAGEWAQAANALYQVSDAAPRSDGLPEYRIIMTETERVTLDGINRNSDAAMNATFISIDDRGTEVRYLGGVRIRGAGSRFRTPTNLRFGFPNDSLWKGLPDINLNTQYTYLQLAAGRLAQKAGLRVADVRAVQVRVNGRNLANTAPDSPQQGVYVALEPLGPDWAENHYPLDSGGNLYRASTGNHSATLSTVTSKAEAISAGYTKSSNSSEDDWTDLIRLTESLNVTPDAEYVDAVERVANVEQWMRYFAFMTLATSLETSLATGQGDDYSLYRGTKDPRFDLIVHDLDTVFGLGDTTSNPNISIFRMMPLVNRGANTTPLNRFMTQPKFVRFYYRELVRMMGTVFAPAYLDPFLDSTLKDFVNPDFIAAMKAFQVARNQGVRNQIALALTVTNGLPLVNGYLQTSSAQVSLGGRANVLQTESVEVNGLKANWTAWLGAWDSPSVTLQPGVNRVLIRSLGEGNVELERIHLDIWFEDGSVVNVPNTLNADTVWSAAAGPYLVQNLLAVPTGRTLTIEAGTTVYFGTGAGLVVAGRLLAEGTDAAHVRFTRAPGSSGSWNGIQFNNSAHENRLVYADFEFAEGAGHQVGASNANLLLDHCTWSGGGSKTILELVNSSALVRSNTFPDLVAAEHIHGGPIPVGGTVRIEGNVFGTTTQLNDIIDFTGAKRPGPVLQILNNVFTAASDDVLDLDGTDAWVEGNLFMHVHKLNPNVGDTSSAISYGEDGGYAPHVLAVRNFFYDVDHVALCKEGGRLTLLHNTAVGVTVAAVNFSEPERNTKPGALAVLDGNIFWNPAGWSGTNFQNRLPTNGTVQLRVDRNLLLPGDPAPGGLGNLVADPRVVTASSNAITAASYRRALSLLPGSPAAGLGWNGLDLGAAVSPWATLAGEPATFSSRNSATLVVGGPGISNYVYRVNDGPWSDERAVALPIQLTGLDEGIYRVEVRGRKVDGELQPVDAPTVSRSWVVAPEFTSVRISEVLARNDRAVDVNGEHPDVIELENTGDTALDLAGFGLSNDPEDRFKYQFPIGSQIPPHSWLVLYADRGDDPSRYLGFALRQTGDVLLLTHPDGSPWDSVSFGLQIADSSLSRTPAGAWTLGRPTFGAANQLIPVGNGEDLLINEWLANPQFESKDDFIEIFNPDPAPVDFGGFFLSDQPVGDPMRHQVPALSFIPGSGYAVLRADGNPNQGADHLGFKLSADQGIIGLANRSGLLVDCVIYGPQAVDRSEGRQPNGGLNWAKLEVVTPGSVNPAPASTTTVVTQQELLLPLSSLWRYEDSGTDLGTEWKDPTFDDAGWLEGQALFGVETTPEIYPLPFTTSLAMEDGKVTYYFRIHFAYNGPLNGVRLIATNLLDDGAAYHLNGFEAARRRLNAGYSASTRATGGPPNEGGFEAYDLSPEHLQQGDNVLAVEVHQNSLNSSDVAFAMSLTASRSVTNTSSGTIVLNEVLANNASLTNLLGETPDWIELYNTSGKLLDLGGMSLTDDATLPRRWVVPANVTLAAGGFLRIRCDADRPASTNWVGDLNTGFGLNDRGDKVLLYDADARGARLLDSVSFGFQAADYSIGRVPDGVGPWTLTFPTLTGTAGNRATATADPQDVKLNEWMANPESEEDWFELFNPASQPVALGGMFLTDDLNDPAKSRIPLLSYVGASTNGLVRFIADSDPSKGADHVAFKLSNGGEALGLFHTNGTRIDTVTFGQQYPGVSQGRLPDGAGEIVFFFHTASPGENNHLPLANVVITEVLTHTDPPLEDALEVQNLGEESIDISGWFLSDTTGNLRKYRIPDGKVLSPGGFAVFYEVEFNALPGHRNSFSFSSVRGDQVYLSQADLAGNLSGYRSTAKFGPAENGVSFGRQVTSEGIDFAATLRRTLGADTPSTTNEFHLGNGATNAAVAVGPVVISEIHYHPPNIQTNDNVRDEFIELRNITPSPVGLFHPTYPTNTWRLRDAVDFDFPRNLTLAADELLLVVGFDPSTNTTALAAWRTRFSVPANVRILGPYVGKLDNGSDKVELYRPDNPQLAPHPDAGFVPFVLVDRVHYSDEAPWPTLADTYTQGVGASLQRRVMASYGNEATNWLAGAPTAGRPTGSPLVTLPAITTQPQGARVSEGLNYTLKVVASGAAPLSYQWRLGAELILNATNSSYTVTSVGATNVGNYTVVVSNPSGAVVSAMALVRAGGAPAVLEDPVPQFVEQGADAVFSVLAGGTQPLRYQWRRNGLNLAQATNQQLLVRNVQPVNAGNYAVVITNVFGSVTSAVATLTLGTRPSITVPPASQDALAGNDVALSVQAAGTGPLAYQWLRGKLPIAGATQANLRLNRVSLGQSGDYSVVVSNLFGSVTSVVARLSVFPLPAVTVTVVDDTAREAGLDPGLFLVTRSYPTNQPLTVFFGLGGTALPGGDYLPVSAVTIPAGEAAAVVTITPIDDKIKEPTELVSLSLALGPGYVVGLPAADTLSLLDDDAVQIGGTNVVELVSITNEWRYEQTQDLSEVLWKTPTFDDSAWPSGPAGLTAETAALPVPKLTPLTLGRWSYYFRTTFHLASTQDVALTAEFAVDDGAVFYLNGEEARRVGMPPGQVVYSTPASQTIGNATLVGPVSLPTTNLVVGRNVLAVEVHQSGIDSSDVVFAMSLAAQLVAEVRLELVDPQLSPAGDFAFNLVGTPSRKVQLETSTDLVSWTVWQIVDLPLTGVLRISERPGSAPAVRFYRARPAF